MVSNGPLYAIAMPLSLLILTRIPVLPTRKFNLGAERFFTLLVICVPIMYGGSIIGTMLSSQVSGGQAVNQISELAAHSDLLTAVAFFMIVAPLAEEWLFRKQIIDRIRRYGEKTAILVSAFAFALFHLNLFQFFYAFGLGLVFGYVYIRTSRLRYSVLMHMAVNTLGGVVAPWVASLVDEQSLNAMLSGSAQDSMAALERGGAGAVVMMLFGLAILALVITGIVLMIVRRRRLEFYRTPEELPAGLRARTVLLNPGIISYIVICVALIVLTLLLPSL